MASISANITDDCRFLSAIYSSPNVGPATITVSNNGTILATEQIEIISFGGQVTPQTKTWSVSELTSEPEILSIQVTDFEGNSAMSGVASSCFLDCCLAKKVLDLSDCRCGEPQCDRNLVEAQRLYLLIQSMNTLLKNMGTDISIAQGTIERAIAAYSSAKNQCISFCGCNC